MKKLILLSISLMVTLGLTAKENKSCQLMDFGW